VPSRRSSADLLLAAKQTDRIDTRGRPGRSECRKKRDAGQHQCD
jgi:hypothetical protein